MASKGVTLLKGEYSMIFVTRSMSWGSVLDRSNCTNSLCYLLPVAWLDGGKVALSDIVAVVHFEYDLLRGGAQHFDYLYQLVVLGLPCEGRLPVDHLNDAAADRPHVDLGGVVGGTEYQLWRSVASRADVGDVGLVYMSRLGTSHQLLG